jgi:hypothetical protein
MQRQHGTRARYVSGPDEHGVPGAGCRCAGCSAANRAEAAKRERLILYGQWQPYVDAGQARAHVAALSAAGIGWKRAAELAGVPTGSISKLLFGAPGGRPPSRRIRPETERKILAVTAAEESLSPGALVDATGARRRLQALVALGYSQAVLAGRLGQLRANFTGTMTRERLTAGTVRVVRQLYDELWDKQPDESTHRTRISASRARNYAQARGWPVPLAWDEPEIDDPAAGPAEGWRRSERTTIPAEELVEDAEFVRQAGDHRSLNARAMRLGISRDRLEHAYMRAGRRQAQDEREAG